jgi:hypothetical protein
MKRVFLFGLVLLAGVVGIVAGSNVEAQDITGSQKKMNQDISAIQKQLLLLNAKVILLNNEINAKASEINSLKRIVRNIMTHAMHSTDLRKYYLTRTVHNGAEARTACAPGFYMASLFEFISLSGLEYLHDIERASYTSDQGSGPPTGLSGWVRTGWVEEKEGTEGHRGPKASYPDCNQWTVGNPGAYGLMIRFDDVWGNPWRDEFTVAPWVTESIGECNAEYPVWCVEAFSGSGG